MGREKILDEILKRKVVAVLRIKEEEKLKEVIEAINTLSLCVMLASGLHGACVIIAAWLLTCG